MRVLLFLLLLIPVFTQAQIRVYAPQDNPNQIRQFRGGIEGLNYFRFPVQGGHNIPAGDSLWFVRVNPGDGQLYMWNGLSWGCMTCGGSGIVDSNLFVTLSRLRDSLSRVQSTLDDSTMVLRGLIAGGSADSSVFATLYRLDTTRAGLDMRISAKQNQLNGTGFVKVSGTTVTYDNSTYVPASRTITINGTSQDLSANRSWTISTSADSSTFATKYGVDTAKANIRTSLNGKLSTSDTATMLGGYLRKGDTASLSNRINAKQNAITLTTTGTSGAATFNQSTGALNIPNYANTTYTGSTSIILTGGSFQRAALTGDVTASANSNTTTIANNAVTNAKAADMAVNTIKGRIAAGTGDPQDLTPSQVRTIINVADGAEVNVNADWNAVSGDAMILNKPTIPDISGLATQQALDDSMGIVRDSISALRADIGSGGGSIDTTSLSNRIDNKVTKGGDSGALSLGSTTNNNVTILQNNAAAFTLSSGNEMTFANSSQFNIAYASGRVIYNAPTRIEYRANNDNSNQMAFNGNLGIGLPNNTSAGAKFEVNGTAGGSSVIGLFRDSIAGDTLFQINNDKTIRAKGLAGTGTRMVMVSPTGVFSTADTTGLWLGAGTVVTNWSGNSNGLNAATGRTSLGGTTVGQSIFTLTNPSAISFIRINANNTVTARSVADTRSDLGGTTVGQSFFTLTNPSAITFPRINANNTVSALSASDFRTAIGAGTGNGTVTSVGLSVPTGFSVSGSPVTTSGTITLSYAAGYQGYTSSEASKLSGIEAGADVTDATNVAAAGAVMDGDFSANGVMVRTASGSYTSRTLTGTANQISVSNADGVSGNPTLSLHSDVTTALGKANTSLQPSDTVSVLFTKSDALIIRRYVDNCTSCTLTVNDHRTILRIANASPVTLYVPTGLQDDFEVLIEQAGAGKITVSALSGVAIGSFESAFTTKGTYATATLYATEEEDEYTLTGNLE